MSAADLVIATGEVKGGKLVLRNRRQFDEQIRLMKDGWQLEVTVQRMRATRSTAQNAWYWSTVLQYISECTGDDVTDLHEHFKVKFNPKRLHLGDEEQVIGGSTRTMNKAEFGEFIEKIRRWASEFLDCAIPDPGF
jgi:hypothetical protein